MNQTIERVSNSLLFQKKVIFSILGGIVFSLAISTLYSLRVLPLEIALLVAIFPFILYFFFTHQEAVILILIALYFGAGYFFSDFLLQGLLRGAFLFFMGLILVGKWGASKRIIRLQTPLDKFFVIWLVVISVAFVNGLLFKHNDFRYLMGDLYKFLEIIFIFWITTFIIRNERQVKFFIWGFFLLVLIFGATDFMIFVEKAQILGSALEARVRAGAQFSSIFALIMAISLLLYEKRRRIKIILGIFILGFFIAFLICFLRTGYIVFPITLLVILALYYYREKRGEGVKGIIRFISLVVFLLVFMGLVSLVITRVNPRINIIKATFERFNSLINPGSTDPMGYRTVEIKCIISQVLAKNPLGGKGLGGKYYTLGRVPGEIEWKWIVKHYVHNNYFEFIMRTGMIGLIVFMLIAFKYLKDALSFYFNSQNKFYKGFLLGCIGLFVSSGMIAFSCSSLYSPLLFSMMAMTYSIAYFEKKERG